jgi:hypothetical protein
MLGPNFCRHSTANLVSVAVRADARAWINAKVGVIVDYARRYPFAIGIDNGCPVGRRNLFCDFSNCAVNEKDITAKDFPTYTIEDGRILDQCRLRWIRRVSRRKRIAIDINRFSPGVCLGFRVWRLSTPASGKEQAGRCQ